MRNRAVLASVGVATATVTTFAGFAPAVTMAGAEDGDDASNLTQAEPSTDGTYESCSAYFGYGKNEGGPALGLTTFPVTVEGGTSSAEAPTVENGEIDAVLVLTDTDGVELRCVPEEVTEAEWDETWGDAPFTVPDFPGPGHYVYPDVATDGIDGGPVDIVVEPLEPLVNSPAAFGDLGPLESVGFEVVGVPDGYTLVDPVAQTLLPQVFGGPIDEAQLVTGVVALVATLAGPDAALAYATALGSCIESEGGSPPNADDPALLTAVQALADLLIPGTEFTAPIDCSDIIETTIASLVYVLVQTTIDTESPITVSLPVEPTTTGAPPPAAAAVVTPTFTG